MKMKFPPSRTSPNVSIDAKPSDCRSVRANVITSAVIPTTVRESATISANTASGGPQSAPKARDVTTATVPRLVSP